jgi:hypothetical protein
MQLPDQFYAKALLRKLVFVKPIDGNLIYIERPKSWAQLHMTMTSMWWADGQVAGYLTLVYAMEESCALIVPSSLVPS